MLNYKGLFPIPTSIFLFAISLASFGCRSETSSNSAPPSSHTVKIAGVYHAIGHRHAERYCSFCHGEKLEGGEELQPSCFACHGKNWKSSEDGRQAMFAPNNHTEPQLDYLHDPGMLSPQTTCVDCHGAALKGDTAAGIPSCFLCHEQIWPAQ